MSETAGTSGRIPLTIEWALWGKRPQDREYGLIDCTKGDVGKKAFTEAITRYSPGDLDRLPEVTIGWFRLHDVRYYIALAIHDPWSDVRDAAGRKVRFTRFFCVPYEQLAAQAVSYGDLYEQLADLRLPPEPDQGPVMVRELTMFNEPTELATRVSALLLANRPVCLLDADTIGLADRLRFLDSVMAQLPYGMRCEMSASTWASATYASHKVRLFFASARRRGEDIDVHWDAAWRGPIGYAPADQYLSFLQNSGPEVQSQLAAMTEPVAFKAPDIALMVATVPAKIRRARWPGARREAGPEDILRSLARSLDDGHPSAYLEQDMDSLQELLVRPLSAGKRRECRAIIQQEGLLFKEKPVLDDLRPRFYWLLLRLAFEDPFGYEDFRAVENLTDHEPHRALLYELRRLPIADIRTRLLILHAFGDPGMIRAEPLPASDLIRAAAGKDLASDHIPVLIGIVIDYLQAKAAIRDKGEVRRALEEHGYLAAALSRAYQDDLDPQIEQLTCLLRLANGNWLDSQSVTRLLGGLGQVPTVALLSAVVDLGGESSAEAAKHSFFQGIFQNARMKPDTRARLLGLLRRPDPPPSQLPHDLVAAGQETVPEVPLTGDGRMGDNARTRTDLFNAAGQETVPDVPLARDGRMGDNARTRTDLFNILIIAVLLVTWAMIIYVMSTD